MVEFALVLPLVLLVLLAMVEVAALVRDELVVVAAAREGARVAATTPDPAAAVRAARAVLGEGAAAGITVTRGSAVGSLAVVEVRYRRRLVTPLLHRLRVPLRGRAVMRVEG